MCLAVPGMITAITDDRKATVDMLGIEKSASLSLVPDAKVGDYILVHAGFGIQIVDPDEARETLDEIANLPELIDADDPLNSLAGAL